MVVARKFRVVGVVAAFSLFGFACDASTSVSGVDGDDADGGVLPGPRAPAAGSAGTEADAAVAVDADPADAASSGGEGGPLGPSTGCGAAGAKTGLAARNMMVAGQQRAYLRSVPSTYQPSTPLPVVIVFHGTSADNDTAAKARASFGVEAKAGDKAIFLYPEALPSTTPAYAGEQRWDPKQGSGDFAFVDALLSEVEASHCVARHRVFATGFSNGGRMASMLGCYRGNVVRAIAPVAPGGSEGFPAIKGCVGEVAVWGGLGIDDTRHTPGKALVLDYYPNANGCAATRTATTPMGCEAYDSCNPDVPVVWCTYPGGHTWPSIGAAGVWGFFDGLK